MTTIRSDGLAEIALPGPPPKLEFAIGLRGDEVLIDFGRPLEWITLTPANARAFALAVMQAAGVAATILRKEM